MRIIHLRADDFKENPVKIPYRKWKKWVGEPKWDEYKDYIRAIFICHEEMPVKESLCWN